MAELDTRETPPHVITIDLEIEGRDVHCNIVPSYHGIQTTLVEVQRSRAYFLEGISIKPGQDIRYKQYQQIIWYAEHAEPSVPIAIIDAKLTDTDSAKSILEMMAKISVSFFGGYLLIKSAMTDRKMLLSRRAIVKGFGSAGMLLPSVGAAFPLFTNNRPDAITGKIARGIAKINDAHPLTPGMAGKLRNRIFAYKYLLAIPTIMKLYQQKGDEHRPYVTSLIVGSAHSDVARLLLQRKEKLKEEIMSMCRAHSMSPEFLLSAGIVEFGTYNRDEQRWEQSTIIDRDFLKEVLEMVDMPEEEKATLRKRLLI